MEDDQQFCLRWNNHQSTLISVFDTLLENQTLVDCTLAAEGQFLKAHKVVLSACSPFFADLLQQQYDKHPIFILKDVKYQELRAMMDYMYRGEVNISQDQLAALLKTAESLQIKGLSDNRSGSTPKTEQHRGLNVHGSGSGGKLSVYTLEQTQPKRPRVGPSPMETTDISGSREGSSSPSRRRKKARRKSAENAMSADVHDNSNSSQINQSSLQPHQQQPQANASLTGVGAITAATSSLPVSASALSTGTSGVLAATGSIVSTQGTTQQMTTNITKKTESVKGASDAMHTENIQAVGVVGTGDEQNVEHVKGEKSNHKQKPSTAGVTGKETADLVIEPKSEYEEEGNEETVEDLTLDDEEMGIEDLDHNAGTSQAGEGSSQGYAPWQHDRSQDELLLAPQETQQRDPQDLSITRIAGLTWNEWNARLAMPLVTQLREGANPLVFPTDLSINTMDKGSCSIGTTTLDCKSPAPDTSSELSSIAGGIATNEASALHVPLNCSSGPVTSAGAVEKSCPVGAAPTSGKMKKLTEEEAAILMLRATVEKSTANNSGNLSDNSFSEDNVNASSSVISTSGDYHSALSGAAAFADVGSPGLCNINILSNISALNSLIGAGGNGIGGTAASSPGSGISGGGSGHPCPECGRVYKLKSSLRNHQKWECGKEPQFQCPFCVYRAKQKMHIGRHMERMHKEKFIKLEDLKSFTGGSADDSGSAPTAAALASTASSELRQNFS
ncbi:longitudinals lacking protein, isoforms A/B/D/L isoform X7 [Anastrepha obliqua]|uniref:longitudinals lacking protein, isoforms A/B/D/L isoform X7 n=1 Tax=Anastrepha obliqua TaxID=95512 RepID=UPI002409C922|nr:longitudinals lacking protein, isoforms A/B/D/L isoform X7 [Anastrepha obliqua]